MANFDLTVQAEAFEKIGVKAHFDENLFGELLDNFAPESEGLRVNFAPFVNWGVGPVRATFRNAKTLFTGGEEQIGLYENEGSFIHKDKIINVFGFEDAESTNATLLHETKHYIDFVSGELEKGIQREQEIKERLLTRGTKVGMLAGLTTGALVGITTREEYIATLASLEVVVASVFGSFVLADTIANKNSPHEIEARKFESEPDILREYGSIIRYGQLA